MSTPSVTAAPSVVTGSPLCDEPGLGTLTLPGFLREVTEKFGDREALVMRTAQGVVRWSYTDLWERSVEVARALRARGVGKDSRVGVLMTNRAEWLSAVFGTSLAGGVAVALSTFSTPAELDHLLKMSGVSVLLFERSIGRSDLAHVLTELEPQIASAAPGTLRSTAYPFLTYLATVGETTRHVGIDDWESFLALGGDEPRALIESTAATTLPSDTAVLFFSSGSTSKPKGILSAHRGVTIQMWRFRRMYDLSPDDNVRCWSANGFFWSGNFGMALGSTLASGGSLVLQSMFDAAEALELMEAEQVNFPVAWPHQWAALEAAPNWATVDLSAMHFVDRNTALARHSTVSTDYTEPGHAYGNTETFTITTCYAANTPAEVIAGSSGQPLPGNTVKIVDALHGSTIPVGERGEICVKGPTLMLGYLGTPLSETLDDEGFFHTGDGGYLDDAGRLYWEGRLTDIIKTGGANVSPLEVDEVLVAHPGVKVTRTVGVPHETLGEVVVACIVPHADANLEPEGVRAYLREQLASYKVPRHVLFFDDDEITLTGSAKIKSTDLRALATKRLST
ncbi:AMP-binding protein [Gordonia sp. SID5947]|uniref:class I adenylate-forming enzyme family protein n=1 Tax=Gordonia sp. SID5947 TaxID=2690315 RepID=UPI001368A3E4|nr:class I adenylate-forming enzyme family protein [Gordonia sp. SID5947]MYR06393.1 AMP-binding protein [Gordonia sp. SID5947]